MLCNLCWCHIHQLTSSLCWPPWLSVPDNSGKPAVQMALLGHIWPEFLPTTCRAGLHRIGPPWPPHCMHSVLVARQRRAIHGVSTATPWNTVQTPALSNPRPLSTPSHYHLTRLHHKPDHHLSIRSAETLTKKVANTWRSAAVFTSAWNVVGHTC